MKIIVNKCKGGYGISDKAFQLYLDRKGITYYKEDKKWGFKHYKVPPDEYNKIYEEDKKINNYEKSDNLFLSASDIDRTDELLISIVEELGEESYGEFAKLSITEIPDDIEYIIQEYKGNEHIAEKHRTW